MIPTLKWLGFDTEAGTAAVGGDEAFYLELVADFHRDYLERLEAIRHEKDLSALERVAHDLKGILQMLGETRVAQLAERWEVALRSDANEARARAVVFDALEQFSRAFRTAISP